MNTDRPHESTDNIEEQQAYLGLLGLFALQAAGAEGKRDVGPAHKWARIADECLQEGESL